MARKRKGSNGDLLGLAVGRGLAQALDMVAYERAYDVVLKDPEVQDAIDTLLVKLHAAFLKRAKPHNGKRR